MPRHFSIDAHLIDVQRPDRTPYQSFYFSELSCREAFTYNVGEREILFRAIKSAISQSKTLENILNKLSADLDNHRITDEVYYIGDTSSNRVTLSEMLFVQYVMKKFFTYDFVVELYGAIDTIVANENLPHFVNSHFMSSVRVDPANSDDIFNPNSRIYQFRFTGIDAYDCSLWSILYLRLASYSKTYPVGPTRTPLTEITQLMTTHTNTGALWYSVQDPANHSRAWAARSERRKSGKSTNIDPLIHMYRGSSMGVWRNERMFVTNWFRVFDEMDYLDSYFDEHANEIRLLIQANF